MHAGELEEIRSEKAAAAETGGVSVSMETIRFRCRQKLGLGSSGSAGIADADSVLPRQASRASEDAGADGRMARRREPLRGMEIMVDSAS